MLQKINILKYEINSLDDENIKLYTTLYSSTKTKPSDLNKNNYKNNSNNKNNNID